MNSVTPPDWDEITRRWHERARGEREFARLECRNGKLRNRAHDYALLAAGVFTPTTLMVAPEAKTVFRREVVRTTAPATTALLMSSVEDTGAGAVVCT